MRTILFVLALLGATAGRGQIVLDWYGAAAPAAGLLLDDYPNAAAAYSLRLLRTGYTGDCMIIRRASDNSLDTIGFLGGYADTTTIATFCASTSCFVQTWYDQSLNGNDVTQATALNQPSIFASGAIQVLGSKKAIKGDGNDFLRDTFVRTQPNSAFYVGNATSNAFAIDGALANNDMSIFNSSNTTARLGALTGSTFSGFTISENLNNYSLVSALWNGNDSQLTVNTTSGSGSVGTNQGDGLTIFGAAVGTTSRNLGFVQEIIIYNSNNTADWTGIQSNINAFYSIY
jgi:Alpha-L-arabinofuranosidase B, catalytic